jgi:hypothetical protein
MTIQHPPTSSPSPLAYSSAAPVHRLRAFAHTWQLLQSKYPSFTNLQWSFFFAEYQPALWVDDAAQTAMLAEDALLGFTNWLDLSRNGSHTCHRLAFGSEALYLARNIVDWSQHARDLVGTDPELTKPESIQLMRALFHRLSVGNSVAERIHQTSQNLGEQIQ